MFEEDVCRSIEENEEALHEFSSDSSPSNLWLDVPRPADIRETARPTTKGQDTIPEEHATFDKVGKSTEYSSSHLLESASVRKAEYKFVTYEKSTVGDNSSGQRNKTEHQDHAINDIVK